ncbi:MAG: monovalent cation/H+ antiporter subunit D family protein [Hyphomonas sp.]|uniref:proton-conducting transporter transmembrane domain-containing protein n=1 Tax=Hyphomonas sp. TaxID=87 RepID=UPI00181211DC|nr:proton-conducting transporter membrane subunit [Hyphomonas sp.]MBA3067725.1 monovalent cation/H+ antiporter subunit D family protein [Hyphomonas sp.]MBU3921976.1 monovalent cation/H+ antiporter subunit D family protein [Alphaproteobacteria bacterium]MBU4062188.1 monovalent cation/H+ antiporter subunit D family protein [Alphaproteobacteria bacterium]MBU4165623.1 monovalent cation/H+ antiporter subunit D family protein [Alphaproteobacteria bacterium]
MTPEMLIAAAICLPVIIAAGIAAAGKFPNLREGVTLIGAVALFAVVVQLTLLVAGGARPELFVGEAVPGLAFAFKLEPLGALFAVVASGLWIVNSFYSIGYMRGNRERNQTRFYICFALALCGAMGVAMSGNLFTLFVFYEVLTLSTYPLVAHKGDAAAQRGARIYLLTLLGTSIGFLLTAIMWTWALAGQNLDFVDGGLLANANLSPLVSSALLLLFVFGVGKAALMPFHFWLPNAMVAPTPVSALLHAVAVVKAGVFTVMKISVYIFGDELLHATPSREFLIGAACVTIVLASLIAMTKDNLKARLAYSTIAQLAYVTLGAMLADHAGVLGGSLQIAAHAAGKMTLFMCAGAIYVATGLTNISDMKGLGRKMPLVFIAFFIASLSIIGIPPLAGDWPKYELMQGAIDDRHDWVVIILVLSSLLNIAYLLPIPILALMPPPGTKPLKEFKRPGGAPALTVAAPLFTAALCFVLFFVIDPVSDFLEPAFATVEYFHGVDLP